ncbi:DUF4837 family protein [Salegentibacter chungangensis]|uniref:DUF4837 family protein n=1 Tax=Salegentibacter chungangensis TaxID=1335724 RepID=A0ABW3NNZ7_9FLAO
MKKYLVLVFSILLFVSCKESSEKNERVLTDSSGNINQLTVVIENSLWEGEVGETIRTNLAAAVDGLPQEEPLFSLSQIPPQTFSGFVRKNRLFLKIEEGDTNEFRVLNEVYARPQKGVVIRGKNEEALIEQINKQSDSIISIYKETELKEKQRRIAKGLKDDKKLKENFGLSLKFPTAYRYAKEAKNFSWIRKEIPKGNMEILIYEVPLSTIEKDTNVIGNIIKMRDSIGKAHIPGPVEGSYMITEEAYAPYLFETEIDGKFAYETRGTWEVKNAFMAGPFVNYAVKDEKNDRYLILEGFVFSPSRGKRDNIFELDAILQSADIK